jgi:tRNA A37 threonylcarbamoyladenosine dehydratase
MIMEEFFSRSEALLGAEGLDRLRNVRVIIFGVGGVGSWCAEALVRTGLTHLTIVDGDTVQPSNVNRQLPATRETLGRPKVEALRERLLSINPDAEIVAVHQYLTPALSQGEGETSESSDFRFEEYDYVIDAIDDVPAKADLIINATRARGVKVFCSMGAALRFDPTAVTTGELMSIKGDALAKAVRARMKKIGLHPYKKVRCVYSTEQAQRCETRGSLMQVTAVFGCTLASLIIRDLL